MSLVLRNTRWPCRDLGLVTLLLVGSCARGKLLESTSSTDLRRVSCLGPSDAKSFAVYLHGMDSPSISDQELGNRQSLARAADALSMRIALPRASIPCPNQAGSLCWGWAFDEAEIDVSARAVKDAAQACFGSQPYGLIGFSNGGYLLSKLLRTCALHVKLPTATWAVTFGSAVFKGPLEPQPASLADCGRLVIAAGTGDTYNFDPTDHLLNALKAKGADVTALRFEGGHLVPEEPLQRALKLAGQR
jgi:predicted esterase